jgi:leucyl/phenylalanyl-tRNA--protein transferase
MTVFKLSKELVFPSPEYADPDGLLAVGGDLSIKRLLLAYQMGIFPWYSTELPILWWSPDPRLILRPEDLTISRRLMRLIKQDSFKVTLDQAFSEVMRECARVKRPNQNDTWITDDMIEAYCQLHQEGYAHSVESWQDGELAGGLYGISLGRAFFGESMFSRESNASKVAFVHLVWFLEARNYSLIDCQITTQHLLSFGAREIPRIEFLRLLGEALQHRTQKGRWKISADRQPDSRRQTEKTKDKKRV